MLRSKFETGFFSEELVDLLKLCVVLIAIYCIIARSKRIYAIYIFILWESITLIDKNWFEMVVILIFLFCSSIVS
jgi:membrane protein insertase Oxa1/YidC/SpoIIIJ